MILDEQIKAQIENRTSMILIASDGKEPFEIIDQSWREDGHHFFIRYLFGCPVEITKESYHNILNQVNHTTTTYNTDPLRINTKLSIDEFLNKYVVRKD